MELKLEITVLKENVPIEPPFEWKMIDTKPSVIQAAALEALRKTVPLVAQAIIDATPNE